MKTVNPKCANYDSFKYSILISLHYYELSKHKERINKLDKYLNNYRFTSNNYDTFEKDNPSIYVYMMNMEKYYITQLIQIIKHT